MTMQDVLWIPSDPTHFVTWGSDIRHYAVVPQSQDERTRDVHQNLNDSHVAVHVETLPEPQFVRCVDVWPGVLFTMKVAT